MESQLRIEFPELLAIGKNPDTVPWRPFHEGVDIHRLYGDGVSGPSAVLLRYQAGASVPAHRHTGYEHILVLAGSQHDQQSTAEAGSLTINFPGTSHAVQSDTGCIVLAIYEKPVEFLSPAP